MIEIVSALARLRLQVADVTDARIADDLTLEALSNALETAIYLADLALSQSEDRAALETWADSRQSRLEREPRNKQ